MALRVCSMQGRAAAYPAAGQAAWNANIASERVKKCLALNTIDLPAWLKSMSSCTRLMSFTGATRFVRAFLLCKSRPGTKPNAALRTCGKQEVAAPFDNFFWQVEAVRQLQLFCQSCAMLTCTCTSASCRFELAIISLRMSASLSFACKDTGNCADKLGPGHAAV